MLALGDPAFTPVGSQPPEPPASGLMLSAVLPGSAAARVGLQAGDVLLRCGEQRLESIDDLKTALAAGPESFRYWREGKEATTVAWHVSGQEGPTG